MFHNSSLAKITRGLLLLPIVIVSQRLHAQTPSASLAVARGFVDDSIHRLPLEGATVEVLGLARRTVTARDGSFTIDSIPAGVYQVTVRHALLDSLGLELITPAVAFGAGRTVSFRLGTPSPATFMRDYCPDSTSSATPASSGAVVGRIEDAERGGGVGGAQVQILWTELSTKATKGIEIRTLKREARVTSDGSYRLCGLPVPFDGKLRVVNGGIQSPEFDVTISDMPLVFFSLRLSTSGRPNSLSAGTDSILSTSPGKRSAVSAEASAASQSTSGTAILTGKVFTPRHTPLPAATIGLYGVSQEVTTNENGDFRLPGLPPGTQQVLARALGYAPFKATVELESRREAHVDIVMETIGTNLDTVTILAAPPRRMDRYGFEKRRKQGLGWYLTPAQIEARKPNVPSDVFRHTPGVSVSVDNAGRAVLRSLARRPDNFGRLGRGLAMRVYIDNIPVPQVDGVTDFDQFLDVRDILAVEIYPTMYTTPPEYRDPLAPQTVGTILIWTSIGEDRRSSLKHR